MRTWGQLLDEYAAAIAAADRVRTDGRTSPPPFRPPASLPATPPTEDELRRWRDLELERRRCVEELRGELDRTGAALHELQASRHAAARYAEGGPLTGADPGPTA